MAVEGARVTILYLIAAIPLPASAGAGAQRNSGPAAHTTSDLRTPRVIGVTR